MGVGAHLFSGGEGRVGLSSLRRVQLGGQTGALAVEDGDLRLELPDVREHLAQTRLRRRLVTRHELAQQRVLHHRGRRAGGRTRDAPRRRRGQERRGGRGWVAAHGRARWRRAAAAAIRRSECRRGGGGGSAASLARWRGRTHCGRREADHALALRTHGGARVLLERCIRAAPPHRCIGYAQLGERQRAFGLDLCDGLTEEGAVDCRAHRDSTSRYFRRTKLTLHGPPLVRELRLGRRRRLHLERSGRHRIRC